MYTVHSHVPKGMLRIPVKVQMYILSLQSRIPVFDFAGKGLEM